MIQRSSPDDRGRHVAPQHGEALVEGGGGGQLGADDDAELLDPGVEQREQHAVLAAEVVVDRAGGPIGPLGDGVDRGAVDAALGEQLCCGEQQPAAGVGPPLPLSGHATES